MRMIKLVLWIVLKLLLLPVMCVVWMVKWIGSFCVFCSAWIFYALALVIFVTSVLSFGFGLEDSSAVLRMLAGSFGLFLVPHVAEYVVEAVSLLQSVLHRFIWS